VGRDLPLADGEEPSLRGQVVRFMGLPHKQAKGLEGPVTAVEEPSKLLEELEYHKALSQKPETAAESKAPKADSQASKKPASKPAGSDNAARLTSKAPPQSERHPERGEEVAPGSAAAGNEVHALLVASLRSQDNAQKLVQQLRAKGYEARLETLDKREGGRWYRVIVGSFKSHDEAQRFSSEFNLREKAQTMAVRVTP
jgi:cell division septation protein DedD